MAIVLGFAAVIGGLVWLGFSLEEKLLTDREERHQAAAERPVAVEKPSSPGEPIRWPSTLPPPHWLAWGLYLVGFVWMLFVALDEGVGWFFAVLFGNYLGAVIFMMVHGGRGFAPMALWTVGSVLSLLTLSGRLVLPA